MSSLEQPAPNAFFMGKLKRLRMNDIGYDDIFIVAYLVSGLALLAFLIWDAWKDK